VKKRLGKISKKGTRQERRSKTSNIQKPIDTMLQRAPTIPFVPIDPQTLSLGNFALTGKKLRMYQRAQKASGGKLPEKTSEIVQENIIASTMASLKDAHAALIEPSTGTQKYIPRFIHISGKLADTLSQLNLEKKVESEKYYTVKFGAIRQFLVPTKRLTVPSPSNPQTDNQTAETNSVASKATDTQKLKQNLAENKKLTDALLLNRINHLIKSAKEEESLDRGSDLDTPHRPSHISAADAKAIHDFHSLKIAWDNVWTDSGLGDMGSDLLASQSGHKNNIRTPDVVADFITDFREDRKLWGNYLSLVNESVVGVDSDSEVPEPEDFVIDAAEGLLHQQFYSLLMAWEGGVNSNLKYGSIPKLSPIAERDIKADQSYCDYLIGVRDATKGYFETLVAWAKSGDSNLQTHAAYVLPWFQAAFDKLSNNEQNWYESLPNQVAEYRDLLGRHATKLRVLLEQGQEVVAAVLAYANGTGEKLPLYSSSMEKLGYRFPLFAPGTINYGLLLTYRQFWIPGNWQVGDMIKTIPLAPKEVRKYKTVSKTTTKRSRKELDKSLTATSSNEATTSRAESEVVRRANEKMGFSATAGGGVEVLDVINLNGSSTFSVDSSHDSADTKKNYRDAVTKAARELKEERQIEILTEDTSEYTEEYSQEISNPNEEITVTYQFYELQRQYQITEELHEVESVLLVAQDVVSATEIDWDWILQHDWILERSLLDDSFAPALAYVMEGQEAIAYQLDAATSRKNSVLGAFDAAKAKLESLSSTAQSYAEELKAATAAIHSLSTTDEPFFVDVFEGLFGGDEGQQIQAWESRRQVASKALESLSQQISSGNEELRVARSALDRAVDGYNAAVQTKEKKIRHVDRLIQHIRDNLLYYQQAIWRYEPADQRYLRLFNREVPFFDYPEDDSDVLIEVDTATGKPIRVVLNEPVVNESTRRLDEIADINKLIGFKGNYFIFPLRRQCYLTAYMAQSYFNPIFEEQQQETNLPFSIQHYAADPATMSVAFAMHEAQIQNYVNQNTTLDSLIKEGGLTPQLEPETIVIPTGCTYIEALTGTHPLLEPFKIEHRNVDVAKAKAEHLALKLENVRAEARLLKLDLEDPQVDKMVKIKGDQVPVSLHEDID